MPTYKTILFAVTFAGIALSLAAQQSGSTSQKGSQTAEDPVHKIVLPQYAPEIPAGPNMEIYRNNCQQCHSSRYVLMQPNFPRAVWQKEVTKMVDAYGAAISVEDQQKIVEYLVAVKGPSSTTPPAAASSRK